MARSRLADPPDATAPKAEDRAVELTFWDSVKDSDNPAMIGAYLKKYPAGDFAPLARIKLDELRDKVPTED